MSDKKEYFDIKKKVKKFEEEGIPLLGFSVFGLFLFGIGIFFLVKGNFNWYIFLLIFLGVFMAILFYILLRKNLQKSRDLIKKLRNFDVIKRE
ncbi:hypothetical protein KAT24_01030 [Candidatus Pacearchaeota archaeon]|nr:hypothetical protein [Candidatus Pacearchaeota archaeon]